MSVLLGSTITTSQLDFLTNAIYVFSKLAVANKSIQSPDVFPLTPIVNDMGSKVEYVFNPLLPLKCNRSKGLNTYSTFRPISKIRDADLIL